MENLCDICQGPSHLILFFTPMHFGLEIVRGAFLAPFLTVRKIWGSNILEPGSNTLEPKNFIFNILERNEEKRL